MKNQNKLGTIVILILITAFLFSTMEVALKLAGGGMDPLQLTFLRFFIGGLVLLPFGIREQRHNSAVKKRAAKERRLLGLLEARDIPWVLLVGIMCIPVSMLCFQLGVERCNAATAAAIMSLNPLITMVIAHFFTEEKLTPLKRVAFVMGIIAGVFLIRPWDVQEGNTVLGMLLMVVAASTFSLYTMLGKQSIAKVGTFTQISTSFIMGSLVLLVVIIIMGRPIVSGIWSHLPLVLYLGIFVTGIAYLCLNIAVKLSDAATGSISFFIKPAMAPVFAVLVLHETILGTTIIGIIFLIVASVLTLLDTKRPEIIYKKG